MRIHYVVNARVPNRKAYGIQLAKMCEAFIEEGIDLTLIVPRTHAPDSSLREFYQLRVDVPVVILPGLDWYDRGRIAFFLSSLVFMCSSLVYLWSVNLRGKLDVVYTIDMDTFSFALLPFVGGKLVSEIHDAKVPTFLYRSLFKHARGIISINTEVKRYLIETFSIPESRIEPAQNGVDSKWLAYDTPQNLARQKLSIPTEKKVAIYTGRFYDWKGLDVLPAACALMPEIECYVVGGFPQEFIQASGIVTLPSNMHIIPPCLNEEVPLWLAAADVLLVLGTKQNEGAYRYRSPMKTYEYMASRRPVVASSAPSLRAIVSDEDVLFYKPDDAADLAEKIVEAVAGGAAIERLVVHAYLTASTHTWQWRARTILRFIESTASI